MNEYRRRGEDVRRLMDGTRRSLQSMCSQRKPAWCCSVSLAAYCAPHMAGTDLPARSDHQLGVASDRACQKQRHAGAMIQLRVCRREKTKKSMARQRSRALHFTTTGSLGWKLFMFT
jgi:hypothetical protein